MRLLSKAKDGGKDSPIDAYFLVEIKGLFSVALLKFNKGGRTSYHTHAFNALTWFIGGDLTEHDYDGSDYTYERTLIPKLTTRDKNHKVWAERDSWAFTIRGPWHDTWTEDSMVGIHTIFTHGRKEL
jgi:hypothetical protein